jgi:glycosyltransferase involved in cell wall biosynthesis
MTAPMITVGMPVYNAAGTLDLAIASVLAQTYPRWILLILDDGSSDGSLEIARKYDDSRIRVIPSSDRRGLCARLNELARLAQTPYLARMDADDVMHPLRLELQLAALTNTQADLVGASAYSIDVRDRVCGLRTCDNRFDIPQAIRRGLFIHPTVMGRTAWFVANPYNSRYERAEDYELWLRTCANSRFYNLKRPLMFYREVGLPYRSKYLRSTRAILRVLRDYRDFDPASIIHRFIRLMISTTAWIAVPAALQDTIIRRRSHALTPTEVQEAELVLAEVRHFVVQP